MAVIFDRRLQQPSKLSDRLRPHLLEWHSSLPLLAVASKDEAKDEGGAVHIHTEQGELAKDALIQRATPVECLQWHPERTILAVGWSSGEITVFNMSEPELFEQCNVHKKPLVFLVWSTLGRRLISGDKGGVMAVWSVNKQGHPNSAPLYNDRMRVSLTHCILHVHHRKQGKTGEGVSALDPYDWQGRSMNGKNTTDVSTAFFCTNNGTLYYLLEGGEHVERDKIDGQPLFLRLNSKHHVLAIVTHSMMLTQYSVNAAGETAVLMNAKLSGGQKITCLDWTYEKVLASCAGEEVVRFWDFDRGENYSLGISTGSEIVTCFSYNSNTCAIAAGTSGGGVVIWSWMPPSNKKPISGKRSSHSSSLSDYWELTATTHLPGTLLQLKWDGNRDDLAANCGKELRILTTQSMQAHYGHDVSAVQVGSSQLLVECHSSGLLHSITTDVHIRGTWVTKEHVAVWSGKKLVVFNFSQDKQKTRVVGSFTTQTLSAVVHEMSVLTTEKNNIHIRTFQGTVKQVLSCTEADGCFHALTLSGHYLAAGTDKGLIKIWDLSRREARLQESRSLLEDGLQHLQIMTLRINSTSSHVSIICQENLSSSQVLLLWEVETDQVKTFIPSALSISVNPSSSSSKTVSPLASHFSSMTLPADLPESVAHEQERLCRGLGKRAISDHYWDSGDSRLLVLALSSLHADGNQTKQKSQTMIVVVFVAPDLSAVISDIVPLDSTHSGLIGVSIPHICCAKKVATAPSSNELSTVARLPMKDYVGLETSEVAVLKAMADFSFFSAIGNMDEAFRAIKSIKSEKVWESMARMCVRTQQLDVAAVCLGNMGNAMAAKAVRESKRIPQPEARLAILAVHLNMLNEAERLYKKSGRHDLLNKFHQASGLWEKAIEEAERNDRMHLKTTYFNYARHAEAEEDTQVAINCYTKSGTHHMQVPRMLFDNPIELEDYVMKSHDSEVCKWWASYLESLGEYSQALQFYELAKDFPSLVRVLCSTDNFERAAEIVEESGSRAAAYQLASRLGTEKEDVERAIHFYTKAQCYSPAIQLAKEHGLDNELIKLALLSSAEDMMDAAKYYECSHQTQDKAIILYHKAGEMSRALELCFQLKQYDALYQIADDLTESTSPAMVARVAEFLTENDHHERAVLLLIKTKQIEEALEMCVAQNIPITEEMAENMTPQKPDNESQADMEKRIKMLERLGDCCAEQGSYHLATKKYTQAGNKTRAMKALLKSGDTEKILFFAGVSRQRDVYVMAANYLQSLDWRKDPEILKNIISFYTKGRALESLASFYDTCAQMEIDEYQDYDKAQGALNEALKCLNKAKSKNPAGLEARIGFVTERLELIRRFADARRMYGTDVDGCIKECQALLNEPKLDTAIRAGDVYGILIEHFAQTNNYREAYRLMQEMQKHLPSVNMAYYVSTKTIETIHSALDIPLRQRPDEQAAREGERASDEESIGEGIEDRY